MEEAARLYVLAEFDARTDARLSNYRDMMIAAGYVGTQTVGINNHITLGSFDLSDRESLAKRVKRERAGCAISIQFTGTGTFGDRVLFLKPEQNAALSALHARFDDGGNWVPHCTMFLSEEGGIAPAKAFLDSSFAPFDGTITRLALYEFFPSKFIEAVDFIEDCEPEEGTRGALLVFLDGTIADVKDNAVAGSAECLTKLYARYDIVYIGARNEVQKEATRKWLVQNGFPPGELILADTYEDMLLKTHEAASRRTFVAGIGDLTEENKLYKALGIRSVLFKDCESDRTLVDG